MDSSNSGNYAICMFRQGVQRNSSNQHMNETIIKNYDLSFLHYFREHYQDGFALMLPRIDISDEPDDAVIDLRDKLVELDR